MSDEVVTGPEDDARIAEVFNSSGYLENDGQMHDVSDDGDADEGPSDDAPAP